MQKEHCMEALLTRLASDMRQTVHHIIGLLELTAEEPLSPGQLQNLSRCRGTADQLLRTASDVSELASSEPLVPSTTPFGLAGAIGEVVDLMRLLADRKGLKLSYLMDSSLPDEVLGDKDVLQDILRRLLENSIKFTDCGGIALSVKAGPVETNSQIVILEIADTGLGMPAEVLAANCGPAEMPSGGGLGLFLVRRRLTDSGGQFTIVDSTSEGTTIRISVPLSLSAAGVPPSPQSQDDAFSPYEPSPLKLLVVEDSDESFALFQAFVKGLGHRISRAVNGALGVEMVKTGEFDLVVMDVHMPVMDGYAATRTIREWETASGRTRLPILLLSAEDASRQMRLGAAVGCSGYIAKPARKSAVLKALSYFGKHQAVSLIP